MKWLIYGKLILPIKRKGLADTAEPFFVIFGSMLSFTQHNLDKLENLLKSAQYKIRYEKGNFKTGACVLENSRIVVVNKFSNLDNKIQALLELIPQLAVDENSLDEKQRPFYRSITQTKLGL